ncbi:MAG: hypothetical protein ABIE55_04500 [Candidatus Aenigmatarchaeota archaeon]
MADISWLYHIIVENIAVIVVLSLLFAILYCNFFGGICPGKWSCNFAFTLLENFFGGENANFALKLFVGALHKSCDLVPL